MWVVLLSKQQAGEVYSRGVAEVPWGAYRYAANASASALHTCGGTTCPVSASLPPLSPNLMLAARPIQRLVAQRGKSAVSESRARGRAQCACWVGCGWPGLLADAGREAHVHRCSAAFVGACGKRPRGVLARRADRRGAGHSLRPCVTHPAPAPPPV